MSDLPYDPQKDFTPITDAVEFPERARRRGEFAGQDRSRSARLGKDRKRAALSYASQGVGSGGHLLGTMFSNALGVAMTHAPYKRRGSGDAGCRCGPGRFHFASYGSVKQYVEAGTVRLLATTAKQRMPNCRTCRQ